MNEQSKIILYKQLMKVELLSKMKSYKVIEWEQFSKLKAKDILKYSLEYRDNALEKFKKDKRSNKDDIKEFYLELPDINLEGEDLSNVYLHMFRAGYSKERNNGKKIFITSTINLKDTNCVVNLATIHPIIISDDGVNIKEISADIQKCDFRGCNVFGKFQNSKAKLIYTDENLPKEYIDRLEKYKVPEEAEITTDYVYIDMLEGKIVKGTNGLDKVKQIVDYDLTNMKKNIWKYREVIKENNIDMSFTGAFIYEYGFQSIGKENYYIDLETRAKDAYKAGNLEYVDSVFDDLDKEARRRLITLALRDGEMKFVKKHQKELSSLQKKYLSIQDKGIKAAEEEERIKEVLRQEYKEGRTMELGIDLMNADVGIRSDIIEEIYKLEDLKFVEKYLNEIDVRIKNEILTEEYRKGNEEFVYRNFKKLDNGDLKDAIIEKEWNNKNLDFLCNNYGSIYSQTLKEKILELAFEEGRVKFLRDHFDELSKNMRIEAIIKFKDLGIPEEKMLELLKK